MKKGILLFGHGARNPQWAEPFHRLRAAIEAREPQMLVELGFLELLQPSFAEGVASLVAQGASNVVVIPIFIAAGVHVREDLPKLAAAAMAIHPGLEVNLASALGEAPEMLAAMAAYALDSAQF